jgi:hypothetical protein
MKKLISFSAQTGNLRIEKKSEIKASGNKNGNENFCI